MYKWLGAVTATAMLLVACDQGATEKSPEQSPEKSPEPQTEEVSNVTPSINQELPRTEVSDEIRAKLVHALSSFDVDNMHVQTVTKDDNVYTRVQAKTRNDQILSFFYEYTEGDVSQRYYGDTKKGFLKSFNTLESSLSTKKLSGLEESDLFQHEMVSQYMVVLQWLYNEMMMMEEKETKAYQTDDHYLLVADNTEFRFTKDYALVSYHSEDVDVQYLPMMQDDEMEKKLTVSKSN